MICGRQKKLSGVYTKCIMYLVDMVVYGGRDQLCRNLWIIHRGHMVPVGVGRGVILAYIDEFSHSAYVKNGTDLG